MIFDTHKQKGQLAVQLNDLGFPVLSSLSPFIITELNFIEGLHSSQYGLSPAKRCM